MTDNTLLGDISKATLAMREDEKQHFSALERILIRCYTEKDQKMAIFMSSDELESATLASVNADWWWNYSLFCMTAKGIARAQTLNTVCARRNMLLR